MCVFALVLWLNWLYLIVSFFGFIEACLQWHIGAVCAPKGAYCLLESVHMQQSVYPSQQHESVQLASSETGGAGLRASTFRLDSSFCCSWKARQQRQKPEQTLLLLCFCHLSLTHTVLHPPALPASFFPSSYHVSLPHFLLSSLSLYHLMLPSIQPFLSVVAHHF